MRIVSLLVYGVLMSILIFQSCLPRKEYSTTTIYSIHNKSKFSIKIEAYNAKYKLSDTFIIKIDYLIDTKNISDFGGPEIGFPFDRYYDSLKVIFNDSVTLTHYYSSIIFSPTDSIHGLPFTDKMNLLNYQNYTGGIVKDGKYSDLYKYLYVITDKDYQEALRFR